MNAIQPCLWFDHQAEEAARFYVSVFPRSRIGAITRYGASAASASGRIAGSVLTVEFELDGRPFLALNGGPVFSFTEAISLSVACQDQHEIDTYWARLSEGGEESRCGWLKDKYGLSWQVVPRGLQEMLRDPDPAKVERVTGALFAMRKLDLAALRKAYDGA